jgi:CHRD domain-containing protein
MRLRCGPIRDEHCNWEVVMSKRVIRAVVLGAMVLIIGVGAYAVAGDDARSFRASPINGYEENPDISTVARGSWEARLSANGSSLHYVLRFNGLEGTVTQSHIHFGKPAINGGISIWLCQTAAAPAPAGTNPPTCPQSGTVQGDVDASDVVGPAGQGIEPGAFGEIIAAMRAGHAYVNVHSSKWLGGEIRAQIRAIRGDD